MPARSLVLLAASLCAGGLAVLMRFLDTSLVLVNDHLNHPFALGLLACVLMALAAGGLSSRWLRATVITLSVLGAVGALLLGLLASMFGGREEAGFVDGPGPYGIRLQRSMAGLGPDGLTWLKVHRDAGLLSREWDLGCVNDDDPSDTFDSVKWTGPSSVEIRVADGRAFPVALDPASGRPRTTISINC